LAIAALKLDAILSCLSAAGINSRPIKGGK
jgi:hypothetical protein